MSSVDNWKTDYQDLWLNIKFEMLKNWKRNRSTVAFIFVILTAIPFYLIPTLTNTDFPTYYYEYLANNMLFVNLILLISCILFSIMDLQSIWRGIWLCRVSNLHF